MLKIGYFRDFTDWNKKKLDLKNVSMNQESPNYCSYIVLYIIVP